MNTVFFEIPIFGIEMTPWKAIGFLGVFLFTSRWFVQMLASRRAGRPVVPVMFWYLSIAGAFLCLAYFIWGKNDSVGVMGYAFPAGVSIYNLMLHIRHSKQAA